MRRFGVLLASAVLGAAVAATGPARAFGGGHGSGFGGGHMGWLFWRRFSRRWLRRRPFWRFWRPEHGHGWFQSRLRFQSELCRLQSWHVCGPERGNGRL